MGTVTSEVATSENLMPDVASQSVIGNMSMRQLQGQPDNVTLASVDSTTTLQVLTSAALVLLPRCVSSNRLPYGRLRTQDYHLLTYLWSY